MALETVDVTAKRISDDDLALFAHDQQISGWEAVSVTRSCEHLPSTFEISMTESFPGEVDAIAVRPGDSCQVFIGKQLVLTGYVDEYTIAAGPRQHAVKVTGRSKCEDLVDCSALVQGGQIAAGSALSIAQTLAKPFGITVSAPNGPGKSVPLFQIMLGETAFEIIERCCRSAGLLVYDDGAGNLVLAQIGKVKAASGFTEGQNVQSATIKYSLAERFSDYIVYTMAVNPSPDTGTTFGPAAHVKDDGVKRTRPKIIISETGADGYDISQLRAVWEKNRRFGRSFALELVADNWRDSAGTLWTPNTLVNVHMPMLKVNNQTWVIATVTYLKDDGGTTARLEIMPPEAFSVEPIVPQVYLPPDEVAPR